jgi:hypothetical protein
METVAHFRIDWNGEELQSMTDRGAHPKAGAVAAGPEAACRRRRLSPLGACVILAALGFAAEAAWGQSAPPSEGANDASKLADALIGCAGLTDKAARLECYDALAQPLLGLDDPASGEAGIATHRFTGTDDWDSQTFKVTTPWRLVWQSQGSLLTVELRTPEDEMLDVIGNQIGRGGGRSAQLKPGTYRLAVRGIGGWRVQVVSDGQN